MTLSATLLLTYTNEHGTARRTVSLGDVMREKPKAICSALVQSVYQESIHRGLMTEGEANAEIAALAQWFDQFRFEERKHDEKD